MSTLLSSWSRNIQSVPPNFVLPKGKRPGDDIAAPICKDIPIIDLSQLDGHDRLDVIQQIMKASMNLGMFQVINHGVSEELMDEIMNLFKEFFNMPIEDKAMWHPEDGIKGFGFHTGSIKGLNMWKDTVKHTCEPNLEDNIQSWPDKPVTYREIVTTYSTEVRKLSLRILDLICEGLGIQRGYFGEDLSKLQEQIVNNYPPCPEPSLVLGAGGHTDLSLITLLQQDIYGLQMFKDGKWLGVEPIPHAFVINVSDILEVISNGKLKSALHRAVTNTDIARTSIVTLFSPLPESIIEPEKSFISASEPQLFKSFQYKDYRESGYASLQDPKDTTNRDAYKL